MIYSADRRFTKMATLTVLPGVHVKGGKQMQTGKGWRLVTPGKKTLKAALLKKFNSGGQRFAIFRVVP
jgi:hypothetical protein